jgi:hypothetical protein
VRRRPRIDLRHEVRARDLFDKINEPVSFSWTTGRIPSVGAAKVFAAAKVGERLEEDVL